MSPFAQQLFDANVKRMRADAAAARARQEQEQAQAEIAAKQRALFTRAQARAMTSGAW